MIIITIIDEFISLKVHLNNEGKGLIKVILLVILIIVLNWSISETPDIVITITPTRETIIASSFAENNTFFELKEYETKDNIVLSSYKTLKLNESSKVRGRIIGIENGKYIFSVEGILIDVLNLTLTI